MCSGISLAYHLLPLELISRHGLEPRVVEGGGEREVQFLRWHNPAVLPLWYQGQLRLPRWGCRRGESRKLPPTAWTWRASLDAGRWKQWGAERVEIPATLVLEGKVWFTVREGLRGLLVRDEGGRPRVYVICQPVSHYYEVMTRARWMPVLIGQQI